jgi:membrane dipeptidase
MHFFLRLSLFLIVIASIYFMLAPFVIENMQNGKESDVVIVSEQAKALHKNLFIADMHADSLLWDRDLNQPSTRGHLDLPRMREGNVALQFFTIVTKSPKSLNIESNTAKSDNITLLAISQLWPIKTWNSLFERAQFQAQKLQDTQFTANENFRVITNQSELVNFLETRRQNPNLVAGLLGLEGAHAVESDLLPNMQALFKSGIRMMAPTHFFDNKIGGSAHGTERLGLSKLGKTFIKAANDLGVIIDLAHASEQTIRDALDISTRPMVVSHTGLRGHCDNNRNLSNDLASEIAQKGGLIAIGFWSTAVCGTTTEAIASAIKYAISVVGEDRVALGSDFDGAVKVPFDASRMIWLTQKLLDQGLSQSTIEKVMGLNQLRFLQANLPNE